MQKTKFDWPFLFLSKHGSNLKIKFRYNFITETLVLEYV